MNTTIGTGMVGVSITSDISTSSRNYYYTRFVSLPVFQTSIAANTWTYNFAASQSHHSINFPVGGSNQPVRVNCYVWRPSTQTKIGTIIDADTASTVDEGAGGATLAHHVTFSGSAVSNVQDNDVIIVEIWFVVASATTNATVAFTTTFNFDGTTVNTTDNASVSNHASFLETPEDINLNPSQLFERSVSEPTTAVTDEVVRTKRPTRNVNNSATIEDAVSRTFDPVRTVTTETPEISDEVAVTKYAAVSLSESFTVDDEVHGARLFVKSVVGSFMLVDTGLSRFLDAVRSLSETPSIDAPVQKVKRMLRQVEDEDTIGITSDTVQRERTVIRSPNETPSISEAVVRLMDADRSLDDESLTVEDETEAMKFRKRLLDESIEISALVARMYTAIRLLPTQSLVFVESLHGAKIFFRNLAESVDISQDIARLYRAIKTFTESVIVDELANGTQGPFHFLRIAEESFTVEDAVARLRRVPRQVVEAMVLVQTTVSKLCRAED